MCVMCEIDRCIDRAFFHTNRRNLDYRLVVAFYRADRAPRWRPARAAVDRFVARACRVVSCVTRRAPCTGAVSTLLFSCWSAFDSLCFRLLQRSCYINRPTPHWNRADQASRFVIYIQDRRHWIVDQALGRVVGVSK